MVYSYTRWYRIIQFCVCFCPFVCLPVRILPMCASVHVSARPPVCIFLCDIVCHSVGLYIFFPFVRSSVRSSVRLVIFCQYECMHVNLLSIYMSVTYLISNFLLLTSYFYQLLFNIKLRCSNSEVNVHVRASTPEACMYVDA